MPRKQDILDLLQAEPNDAFLLYALAMEYINEGDLSAAVQTFDRVVAADPGYSAAFYHKAKTQLALGEAAAARATLATGLEVAVRKGDLHTVSEMEALLEEARAG